MAIRMKPMDMDTAYRSFYRQVQVIEVNDNRTLDERLKSLPTIREEDLSEWREWAEANVLDNR